jgi:hypothetical protein
VGRRIGISTGADPLNHCQIEKKKERNTSQQQQQLKQEEQEGSSSGQELRVETISCSLCM